MSQSMIMYVTRDQLINANDRMHWARKAARVKHLRATAGWSAKAALNPVSVRQRVVITYGWAGPNRVRDVSNLQPTSKACADGITDANIWPDDNDAWMVGPDNRFGEPSDRPGLVKITITLESADA